MTTPMTPTTLTPSMTRADRLSDLLAITSRLIACMEREVELLRAMRPQDIAPLQVDKTSLADAYEAHLRALHTATADEDEAVDQTLRDELVRATEQFQDVLAENARALKAVKAANDRVLKAIVDAVERNRGPAAAYTAAGTASGSASGAGKRPASPAPVSIAVDQRL